MPFDGEFPEISDQEAFQIEVENVLADVATGLDGLFTDFDNFVAGELNSIDTETAPMRADLFTLHDDELQDIKLQAGTMMAGIMEMSEEELGNVAASTQQFRSPVDELSRTNPFATSFDACLDREANHTFNAELQSALLVDYPNIADAIRVWLLEHSLEPAGQLFHWGENGQTMVWSCPGPPIIIPPNGKPPVEDCGTVLGVVPEGHPVGLPTFSQATDFGVPQPVDRGHYFGLDLAGWQGLMTTPFQQSATYTPAFPGAFYGEELSEFGTFLWVWGGRNSDPQVYEQYARTADCGFDVPLPEQVPLSVEDLLEKLCECLGGKDFKGLTVYQDCDTCNVVVVNAGDEVPAGNLIAVSRIGKDGVVEKLADCPVVIDDEPPEIDEKGDVVPRPRQKPAKAAAPMKVQIELGCAIAAGLTVGPIGQQQMLDNLLALVATLGVGGVLAQFGKIMPAMFKTFPMLALFVALGRWSLQKAGIDAKEMCDGNQRVVDLVYSRQMFGFWERILPGGFGEQIQRQSQEIAQNCPWKVPTLDQANRALLAQKIDVRTWQCWVSANGFVPDDQDFVVESMRTRPGVNDVNMLRRRKILNRDAWAKAIQGLGFTDPDEADQTFELTEQRPGLSDIIRFMVRDAADQDVVDAFEYDKFFDKKYKGKVKEWAEDQGIPEDVARFAWRSHWIIPPPTTLYTMLNRIGRFDNGDYDVKYFDKIVTALEVQDIAPGWIDDLIKISTKLPTRVDVRRVYRTGIFSEQDVLTNYIKLGYTTQAAKALTKFTVTEANRMWTANINVKRFARGELTEDELKQILSDFGAVPAAQSLAVDHGRIAMKAVTRKKCLAAIKHKVMQGEITRGQATTEANNVLPDPTSVAGIVDQWYCERASKSKTLSAAQLLGSFKDGLLSSGQLATQLINIGYPADDANVLVNRASLEIARKIERAELLAQRKAIAAAEKQAKEAVRAETRRVSDAKRTAAARAKSIAASERREGILLDAAKLVSNRSGQELTRVYSHMLRVYRVLLRQGGFTAQQLADTAKKVAGSKEATNTAAWEFLWLEASAEQVDSNGG